MPNEEQLCEGLIAAFERLRDQQSLIFSLTVEVAALRESLCKVGPGYDDLLSEFRAKHSRESAQAANDSFRQYEEIIQRLRSGSV